MKRRTLLAASAIVPIAGCGIISSTNTNGVTTVTVSLTNLNNYVHAVTNGVALLLSVSLISNALGSTATGLIKTLVTDIAAASATLTQQADGAAVLLFTASSIPAALTALQGDVKTIGTDFSAVATSLGSSLASNVLTTVDALQIIVSVVLALTNVGATPNSAAVDKALLTLGVPA